MTLGRSPSSGKGSSTGFCAERLSPTSIYGLLHRDGDRLFSDEAFVDLFQEVGRWSVAPRIVAVVMVLQRLEGLSDRGFVGRGDAARQGLLQLRGAQLSCALRA
jgi:hypothetical protein